MSTECSMSDNVAVKFPQTEFIRPCNLCPHMKRIVLPKILRSLETLQYPVVVDPAAKVEHILERRTFLPELGALGCLFVVSAVESLSDTVLTNLEKGHTRADVYEALRIVKAAGIVFRPTWVAFTPWTTLDDYLDVLDFVEIEGLVDHVDPVQYTIRLLIPPGSMLLDRPAIRPFLGPLDQAAFSYRWSHPDRRPAHGPSPPGGCHDGGRGHAGG